jgi:hypothetical protein
MIVNENEIILENENGTWFRLFEESKIFEQMKSEFPHVDFFCYSLEGKYENEISKEIILNVEEEKSYDLIFFNIKNTDIKEKEMDMIPIFTRTLKLKEIAECFLKVIQTHEDFRLPLMTGTIKISIDGSVIRQFY